MGRRRLERLAIIVEPREPGCGTTPTAGELTAALAEELYDLPFDVSVSDGNGSAWRIVALDNGLGAIGGP